MTSKQDTMIERNAVEARQDSRRPHLVVVLGASLILLIAAFAAVWLDIAH